MGPLPSPAIRRYLGCVHIDDSDPEARRAYFDWLREIGPDGRMRLCCELTEQAIAASRDAIRRSMPGATEQQVILRWIELEYGEELARRVEPFAYRLGRPQET